MELVSLRSDPGFSTLGVILYLVCKFSVQAIFILIFRDVHRLMCVKTAFWVMEGGALNVWLEDVADLGTLWPHSLLVEPSRYTAALAFSAQCIERWLQTEGS